MRLISIDLLRAWAIFLMVLVHFVENLSGVGKYAWLPAGVAAPLFAMLSGVSLRIWARGLERRGVSEVEITKRSARRGLFLIGVGFAFNVLVWMPEDTFNWDVLTFIGISIVTLAFGRRLPEPMLVAGCVGAFIFSPVLRYSANYASYWQLGYFDPDMTLSDVVLGATVTGYFPLLPWIIYPIVGYLAEPLVYQREGDASNAPRGVAAKWGVGLLVVSAATLAVGPWIPEHLQPAGFQRWTMFPPSIAYVAGSVGFSLLAIDLSHRWIDVGGRLAPEGHVATIARTFSVHSLSMYVLHHVAHLWPLWIYGAAQGHDPTHYWQLALPAWGAIVVGFVFVVAAYHLFRWMDRRQLRGIEGLMRWISE